MPLYKAFRWIQHIQNLTSSQPKVNRQNLIFLIPHSGRHSSRFLHDLGPTSSSLGGPWRQLGSQMASQITQVVPKVCKKLRQAHSWAPTYRRFESNERRFECNVARCTHNAARCTQDGSFVEWILIEF